MKPLHWLPVRDRIALTILMFEYICMNDVAPAYLSEHLESVSYTRCLRSIGQNLLKVTMTSTVSYGDRIFFCCGPKLWSSLPLNIRNCESPIPWIVLKGL